MNKKILILPLLGTLLLFSCDATKQEVDVKTGLDVLEKSLNNGNSYDKVGYSLDIDSLKFHTIAEDVDFNDGETIQTVVFSKISLSDFSCDFGVHGLTSALNMNDVDAYLSMDGDFSFSQESKQNTEYNYSYSYKDLKLDTYIDNSKLYVDGSNETFAQLVADLNQVSSEVLNLKVYQDIDTSELTFPLINEDTFDSFLEENELDAYVEMFEKLDLSKYGNAFKMYKEGNEYVFEVKITSEVIGAMYVDMITSILPIESKPSDSEINQLKQEFIDELNSKIGLQYCNFSIEFTESGIEEMDLALKVEAPQEIISGYQDAVVGDILIEIDASVDFIYGKDVLMKRPSSYDDYIKLEGFDDFEMM